MPISLRGHAPIRLPNASSRGQPAGGVLALDLPVQAWDSAQGVVPAHERFDQRWLGFADADAPPEEGADSGQAVANAVIGDSLAVAATPGKDLGLPKLIGMAPAGDLEQCRQVSDVLMTGLTVRVPIRKLGDERRGGRRATEGNDLGDRRYAVCILISMSTPAGRSRRCNESTVFGDGSRMSSRRLWTRISKCSRLSLSLWGDRITV